MSVLVPDHEVFSYLYSGLIHAAISRTFDDKYSWAVKRHMEDKDDHCEEAKRLVKSWLTSIEKSYNAAYNDTETTAHLLKPTRVPFGAVQLLKYLQCVSYNIERPGITTQQEQDDMKLLEAWKNDVMNAIISQLPEYKDAKWSEF